MLLWDLPRSLHQQSSLVLMKQSTGMFYKKKSFTKFFKAIVMIVHVRYISGNIDH